MHKNKPDIFALCETNLHDNTQDSDFQLPGYLPIHRKDAGHMHGLGVYAKSNLPIAREPTLEEDNESYMCLLPIYFSYIVRHLHHRVLWLRQCLLT